MPLRARLGKSIVWAAKLTEADRGKAFRYPIYEEALVAILPTEPIIHHFCHNADIEHGAPET